MFPQAFHDLSKAKVMVLIESLKKSEGMGVSELAKNLEMSYMGAKQICLKLESKGYLKTWRVPRSEAGRPEKKYRLTEKCDIFFPQAGVGLTLDVLEGVRQLYGENAPEKLIYYHFEECFKTWSRSVSKGKSLIERATRMVELKQKEGCFCSCQYKPGAGFIIEEFHHPMEAVFRKYPSSIHMEVKMMERLLGTAVERQERRIEKNTKVVVYRIETL